MHAFLTMTVQLTLIASQEQSVSYCVYVLALSAKSTVTTWIDGGRLLL